jgi:hypothetical protein
MPKDTTRRADARKGARAARLIIPTEVSPEFVRCAGIVADLLAAEDTPAVLQGALEHFCVELVNQVAAPGECCCSPETTRKHLPALLARADQHGLVCDDVSFAEAKRGGRDAEEK